MSNEEINQIATQIAELKGETVSKVMKEATETLRRLRLAKLQRELLSKLSGGNDPVEQAITESNNQEKPKKTRKTKKSPKVDDSN